MEPACLGLDIAVGKISSFRPVGTASVETGYGLLQCYMLTLASVLHMK